MNSGSNPSNTQMPTRKIPNIANMKVSQPPFSPLNLITRETGILNNAANIHTTIMMIRGLALLGPLWLFAAFIIFLLR